MQSSNTLGAVLWMTGALAAFTTMAISVRELSPDLSVMEIAFMRSVICTAILVPIVARQGFHTVRTRRFGLHVGRNLVHYGGILGWFYGITVLPLAAVFALEFTTPIWTACLAALLLGERLTRHRLAAVAIGFAGILVILRPGSELIDLAAFVVIGAAVCYAGTYVFTRHMAATESPLAIIFHMNLIQIVLGLAPTLPVWVTPGPEHWPWLAAVGLSGLASHWCIAHAFRLADATVVAPLDFLRLPLVAVVGVVAYAEPWNSFVLAGGALIFCGNLVNIWGERRRAGRAAA